MPEVGDDVSFKLDGKTVEGEIAGFEGGGKNVRIKITKRPKGIPAAIKFAIVSRTSVNYDPILGAAPMPKKGSRVAFKISGKHVEGVVEGMTKDKYRVKVTKAPTGVSKGIKMATVAKSEVEMR